MSVYIKYQRSDSSFSEKFNNILKATVEQLLEEYNLSGGEVGIIVTDNLSMQKLNSQYRDKDMTTDVLSFSYIESDDHRPEDEVEFAVGDIYISIEKAHEQAEEAGHSLIREIFLLAVHGMLHLLGFEHLREADARLMKEKENAIIDKYNDYLSG